MALVVVPAVAVVTLAKSLHRQRRKVPCLRAYNWTRSLAIDGFSVAAVADAVAAG